MAKKCHDCNGRGTRDVQEYDPDRREWVRVPPVTCGGCNGTGRQ